jgi:hypothetical protein
MIEKGITTVFSERTALSTLQDWCEANECRIMRLIYCARFDYADEPFWGVTLKLFSWGPFNGIYGFHIYGNGIVKLVSREVNDAK